MEQTIQCRIEGMTCGNCALTVSKYLQKQGMKDVSAIAATGEVSFTAPGNTNLDKIYKGIDNLGYHVSQRHDHDEHQHNHAQHGNLHGGNDKKLAKMAIVCALFTAPLLLHMFLGHRHFLNNPLVQLALCTPVYLIGMWQFGRSAFRSLRNGIPNMDVLVALGATAAYVYSLAGMYAYGPHVHNYLFFETTATIVTFVLVGNWLEAKTVTATTSSIRALATLQPSKAHLIMTDSIGKEMKMEVDTKDLRINDTVAVNDGDSIPADGVIISGHATIDESMITGESLPVQKSIGAHVTGGTILKAGNIRVKATAVGESSALAEIIRLVQKAQAAKPPMQKLADKISAIFVPMVLGMAALTFLLNYFAADVGLAASMMRSIAVLVIACPCAMGLATPAAIAVGLGRAARNGILVKGADTLEKFKDIKQIVFDKTGTLTTGKLKVAHTENQGMEEATMKAIVVGMEQASSHPIAKSLVREWGGTAAARLNNVTEIKGEGMEAVDEAGNKWQLGTFGHRQAKENAYDLNLVKNGDWVAGINLQDELRTDAKATLETLAQEGFRTILLTGDQQEKADNVAAEAGIDTVYAQQSPVQKMEKLEQLLIEAPTAMVGDGINDSPALARADIGISLSDATKVAMQSANVILSNNQLASLPKAIKLGKFTYRTIKQNLFWAFFYNVLAIPLAAMGYLSPIWAAMAMAFSDVVLVLNSLRLNYRKID
ncbi:MAG: cation-translocating P-type ATPase [Edaphocola sp.]